MEGKMNVDIFVEHNDCRVLDGPFYFWGLISSW